MSININVNKATPTSYELVFPLIPTETAINATEEFSLNIYGTIIPGLNLDSVEHRWMGAKFQSDSGNVTFDPWTVSFIVDSEFNNWKLLYRWITFINNNKDKFGEDPANYVVDATLRVTDNFRKEVLRIHFINVWINMLGEITLTHREGETLLESTVNFAYDYFEIRET